MKPIWRVTISLPGLNISHYIMSDEKPNMDQITAAWTTGGGTQELRPPGWEGPLSKAYPGVSGIMEKIEIFDATGM